MYNKINKKFINYIDKINTEEFLNGITNLNSPSLIVTNKFINHLIETNNEYLIDNVFTIVNIKNDKIHKTIKIIKVEEFNLWIENIKAYYEKIGKVNNRSEIAMNGINTHNKKTQYNFLLLSSNNVIKTILFNKDAYKIDFKIKKNIFIIENLDVFFEFDKIKNLNNSINLNDCDIVYGSGNSITNKYFYDFLNNYKNIYTFLDLDLGGFKIYTTLKKNLTTDVQNIYVNNIENYFKLSKFDHKIENIHTFIKNNKYLSYTDIKILNLMDKNSVGIEQEIFLENTNIKMEK